MKLYLRQIRTLTNLSLLELYRRKDLWVVLILSVVILAPLSVMTTTGTTPAYRTVNEVALLLIWIFAITINLNITARLLPAEFESRTIYPLLAKPIRRPTLLFGKYCGALVASLSALALFYLVLALLLGIRQGVWGSLILLQALLLHAACLAVTTAITLLGSLFLSVSANLTLVALLVVGMLTNGQQLCQLAATQSIPPRTLLLSLHWLAPHLEFFDLRQRLIHDWPPVSWLLIGYVLLYAAGYITICLTLAGILFQRKRL